MARAAVKAKQQQARKKAAQQASKSRGGRRKRSGGGNPNQQLFFERMRRHAKWAYVVLALLFAITFAALGVGSGSNSGLSQIFSGIFGGGSATTSVSQALSEVTKNPKSAKAYRDLATAYEAKGETAGAISALTSYTKLKKKDSNAWAELGGLQLQQANSFAKAYQQAANAAALAAPSQPFLPSGTLGTAIGTNPIEQAAAQSASTGSSTLYQQALTSYQSALTSFRTVAKLHPNDANAQFNIAQVAQDAGDYTTAVAAYKEYLKLNPASTQRAQIESLIKQLSPAPAKSSKTSTSTTKTSTTKTSTTGK